MGFEPCLQRTDILARLCCKFGDKRDHFVNILGVIKADWHPVHWLELLESHVHVFVSFADDLRLQVTDRIFQVLVTP